MLAGLSHVEPQIKAEPGGGLGASGAEFLLRTPYPGYHVGRCATHLWLCRLNAVQKSTCGLQLLLFWFLGYKTYQTDEVVPNIYRQCACPCMERFEVYPMIHRHDMMFYVSTQPRTTIDERIC